LRVAQLLDAMGGRVHGADPHVVESIAVSGLITRVEATSGELAAADIVVLLTDHDVFDADEIARHATLVLDCRNRVRGVERL